jgi:hypothetical protein
MLIIGVAQGGGMAGEQLCYRGGSTGSQYTKTKY